jgi:ferric-dicitrate binding protein FerR (iron transport regulator)
MILDDEHILLISKYLAKEATEEEISRLNEWISSDKAHKAEFESHQKAWENSAIYDDIAIDVEAEWQKFKSKTRIGEQRETKIKALDAKYAERFSFKQALRIAAVILLFLLPAMGIYFYVDQNKAIEIASFDQIKESPMPDGSTVTLNQKSAIAYHKDYGKTNRKLSLKGEAFFSVAPDKSKPFIVDVNEITVTVTGTSFYIDATENEDKIKVIVESGTVIVKSNLEPEQTLSLKKGDKAVFSKTGHTLSLEMITEEENYHSWLSKKMTFKEVPLKDIVRDLNHAYHRNIVIKDKEIENCRISASFDRQTLEQILNVIENTIDINITEKENSIEMSGKGC